MKQIFKYYQWLLRTGTIIYFTVIPYILKMTICIVIHIFSWIKYAGIGCRYILNDKKN
ncbi:MAG: hypothetical protein WDO16_24595 [Bacteroidota bacterium]